MVRLTRARVQGRLSRELQRIWRFGSNTGGLRDLLAGTVRGRPTAAAATAAPLGDVRWPIAAFGGGTVVLELGKDEDPANLSLKSGGTIAPFHLTPPPPPSARPDAGVVTPFPFNEGRLLGWSPQAKVRAAINPHVDWSLPNALTLTILASRFQPGARVQVNSMVSLPAGPTAFRFRALLAIHRAEAELCIAVHSADGSLVSEQRIAFEQRYSGGQHRSGYQRVIATIDPAEIERHVTFSIIFKRSFAGAEEFPPHVFVAAPEILADEPGMDQESHDESDKAYFTATLPMTALRDLGEIVLTTGTENQTIFTAPEVELTLLDVDGPNLRVQADRVTLFTVYVDGTYCSEAVIGRSVTTVRLPQRFMDGERHLVSLRDETGTAILLEAYVTAPPSQTPTPVLQIDAGPPFPGTLFPQGGRRYEAMRAAIAEGLSGTEMAVFSAALAALEAGEAKASIQPLSFPEQADPDVSIIIPAHNIFRSTYLTLAALIVARCKARFEVILVDDGSTDETTAIEGIVSGVTVHRSEQAAGFLTACNRGAALARGAHIVLLNNDTEPTTGWLDELLDAFGRFENVGLAGSRLIYPTGELQDAGGIIWNSGNPWNYGNGQNPWEPRFSYARQADYLSGAALMVSREVWQTVGGFSDYLKPMYFEDTDLAFKVREAGFSTWYVPSSVVYHYEGKTSGRDVSSGAKSHQEVNRPRFKERWADAYARFGQEGVDPDLEKDRGVRGRILFIDYSTPRPDHDAGSYAALREMELVQALGYKVTFVPQNLAWLGRYTEALERQGVEVIRAPFAMSVKEVLDKRGAEFDAIYITRYYVGAEVIDDARRAAPEARIILNNADLHFLRMQRSAEANGDADLAAEAERVRLEELTVMRMADLVLSYNEVEHGIIREETGGAVRVATCPWVLDIPETVPPRDGRAGISFLGNYRHPPNAEAMTWFAGQVMEGWEGAPELSIYGSGMDEALRDLAVPGIDPVGFVEDVATVYDRHLVFVAPLQSGAGIKGKVLAALAHGVPTVLSPVAAEGIGLTHGTNCLIAETPEDSRAAVEALIGDAELWSAIGTAGRQLAQEKYAREPAKAVMAEALRAAGLKV